MNKVFLILVAVVVVGILLVSGCTPTPAPAPAPSPATKPAPSPAPAPAAGPIKGGTISICTARPATNFGYPPTISGVDNMYAKPFFDNLVFLDKKGVYQPELATNWDIASDGKSITFKLRQGVKFHDGTDFNADAVKFNYDPYIPPKSSILAGVSSIDKIDNYTVKFNLPSYSNLILYSLAVDSRCGIASPTAIQKNGADWARTNPVGTGPFKLEASERNVSVTYTRNPDYWDKNLPYLDKVKFIAIADQMTQMAAFKTGEINVIWDAKLESVAQLTKEGYQVSIAPGTLQGITGDTDHPDSVFANQKVREAMEYAIDKEAIVNGPGMGVYKSAYQTVTTDSPDYNPACPPRKYDPVKAKQLLTEAGYANGFSFKLLISDTEWMDGPTAAQNYLSKVGITMDIVKVSQAAFLSNVRLGKLEKNTAGFLVMEVRSQNLFMINQYLVSTTLQFQNMVKPAGLDDLISRALEARNDQDRIKLTQQIAKAVYDNETFIPLWIQPRPVVVDKKTQDPGFLIGGDSMNARPGRFSWLK